MSEAEILNDFSQSNVLEIYRYDYIHNKLNEYLDKIKYVLEPSQLVECEDFYKMAFKASVISRFNIMNLDEILDEFRKQNRANQFIDLYILLLKSYQFIGL